MLCCAAWCSAAWCSAAWCCAAAWCNVWGLAVLCCAGWFSSCSGILCFSCSLLRWCLPRLAMAAACLASGDSQQLCAHILVYRRMDIYTYTYKMCFDCCRCTCGVPVQQPLSKLLLSLPVQHHCAPYDLFRYSEGHVKSNLCHQNLPNALDSSLFKYHARHGLWWVFLQIAPIEQIYRHLWKRKGDVYALLWDLQRYSHSHTQSYLCCTVRPDSQALLTHISLCFPQLCDIRCKGQLTSHHPLFHLVLVKAMLGT